MRNMHDGGVKFPNGYKVDPECQGVRHRPLPRMYFIYDKWGGGLYGPIPFRAIKLLRGKVHDLPDLEGLRKDLEHKRVETRDFCFIKDDK